MSRTRTIAACDASVEAHRPRSFSNSASPFARRLAAELTQYGSDALEMAQVFEAFCQNKNREWFEAEIRRLKGARP